MPRNLDARIEAVTPVEDPELRADLDAILDLMLADTAGAWLLDGDGQWTRRARPDGESPFSSQGALMSRAQADAEREGRAARREAAAERRLVRRGSAGDRDGG